LLLYSLAAESPTALREIPMDTDRNLLFGVLALQADLIDPQQFIEACLLWTSRKYRRDDQKVIQTEGVFEDIEEHLSVEAKGKRYLHTLKTAVRDASGKVIGMQGISWDVTARRAAEEELRRSRERFELAVLASQDGLWDWDVEANQVWYSPQMRMMLGY